MLYELIITEICVYNFIEMHENAESLDILTQPEFETQESDQLSCSTGITGKSYFYLFDSMF